MAWIEVHQALPTHRKTLALASLLDVDPEPLVGHLVCLWLWALDNAPDGVIEASPRIIARVAGWRGDHDAFVAALETAGFAERVDDLKYIIHDWDDYAGKLVDRRKSNAERMRAARASLPNKDVHARAEHVQRTVHARVELPDPTQPDPTLPDREVVTSPIAPPPTPRSAGGESRVPLVELSDQSREVLDAWRLAQGLRAPPKLNPTQAAALEEAVADLGPERLKAACTWAAGEGITVLTKAIRGARTRRQREEQGTFAVAATNGTGHKPRGSSQRKHH